MKKRPILAYALYLLGRRGRTRQELRDLLLKKRYDPDEVGVALTELTRLSLLDDAAFAQAYARDKVAIYRRGRYRIGLELVKKGVSRDQIDEALQGVSSEDELAAAESLARARLKHWQALEPLKKRARLVSLLQRRGFSGPVVRQVTDALL